jgi:NADH dehydrogenase/NADH:ubiquinone oxidoreductase subunit G
MSDKVKLTIDGKEVAVPEGTNIIDAAETAGIHIPNLCYLKGMKGIGACRLCLVEVEGGRGPVIACNAKVKDGMVVDTKTDKVVEARKFVIDLILSMHPLDCMTCTKAGVCTLQKYAYDLEIQESSFSRKKFGYEPDTANDFVKRDPEYCILCARCVRVCKEQGTNVLDFMGRGVGAKVITAEDKPLQESGCTFCGSCVDACPVNALLESDRWRKGREWDYEKVSSACLLCGNGCDITVSTKDGKVMKVNSGQAEGSVEKYICAYGRYGFDCIEAETRVTAPMVKKGNKLEETTWDEAIGMVAEKLKKAGKDAGFISVAGIQNEDAIAMKALAKTAKTKNFDTTMSLYADADTLINSQSADLDSADLIIMAGLAPSQWERVLPQLDAAVRRRADRGAKLVVINAKESRINEAAEVSLTGNETASLKAIVKAAIDKGLKADKKLADAVKDAKVSEDAAKAGELLSNAGSPVVLASPAVFDAAANLALAKGSAVAVPAESNAKGVALMGLTTEGKSYKEMASGDVKVLYAVGEVPLKKSPKVDFLVVQNSHLTDLAKHADVVLPSATFLESAGTMVDYMGRLKYLPEAIEPQGESMSHKDIFVKVAKAMGGTVKKPTEAEVKKAAKAQGKISLKPFEAKKAEMSAGEIMESVNSSVFNGSRLIHLKEYAKAAVKA